MTKQKAPALLTRPRQKQRIAPGPRPCLNPGARRCGIHGQDFDPDPIIPHPVANAHRLGGAVGPDIVIDDKRPVAMPAPRGEILRKNRQRAAVRPARQGGEQRLARRQMAKQTLFESGRERC